MVPPFPAQSLLLCVSVSPAQQAPLATETQSHIEKLATGEGLRVLGTAAIPSKICRDVSKRLTSLQQASNGRCETSHGVGRKVQTESSRQKITADSPPVSQRKVISCPSQPEVS